MSKPNNPLHVVCAVITNELGEILACQRNSKTSLAGKWEFPGGKIEQDETHHQAIQREILEELGVEISISEELETVNHQYPDFDIALHPYHCKITSTHPPQALEHAQIKWTSIEQAQELDWADADIFILREISNKLLS